MESEGCVVRFDRRAREMGVGSHGVLWRRFVMLLAIPLAGRGL